MVAQLAVLYRACGSIQGDLMDVTTPSDLPAMLTTAEAAKILKLNRRTIVRIFSDLPGVVKLKGPSAQRARLRIPSRVLQSWCESNSGGGKNNTVCAASDMTPQ